MNQIKKLFPAFALMVYLGMNPVCSLAAEVNVIPTPVKLTQQRENLFCLPALVFPTIQRKVKR